MNRPLVCLFLMTASVYAKPDELHTCLAWLSVYEQSHAGDHNASTLKTALELEMKKDKVYNTYQMKEASADPLLIQTAQSNTSETSTALSYCSRVSADFIR